MVFPQTLNDLLVLVAQTPGGGGWPASQAEAEGWSHSQFLYAQICCFQPLQILPEADALICCRYPLGGLN